MTYEQWCQDNFGYTPTTISFYDLQIAEKFGLNAIKQTYTRLFKYCKLNYKNLTDLCMALNHRLWMVFEKNNQLGELYDKLWRECTNYAYDNLKGEELTYFYKTTD